MPSRREMRDQFAGEIQKKIADENRQHSAEQFEERLVKLLLSRFGLSSHKRGLLQAFQVRTGQRPRLLLSDFNELFPSFPFVLAARQPADKSLHTDVRCTFSGLMLKFLKSPYYQEYCVHHEQQSPDPNDRAIGLVFPHQKVRGGLVVYRDASLSEYLVGGTAVVHRIDGTEDTIVVQRFETLLVAIKRNWQSE